MLPEGTLEQVPCHYHRSEKLVAFAFATPRRDADRVTPFDWRAV